jgi:hypothetical protein
MASSRSDSPRGRDVAFEPLGLLRERIVTVDRETRPEHTQEQGRTARGPRDAMRAIQIGERPSVLTAGAARGCARDQRGGGVFGTSSLGELERLGHCALDVIVCAARDGELRACPRVAHGPQEVVEAGDASRPAADLGKGALRLFEKRLRAADITTTQTTGDEIDARADRAR